MQLNKLERQTVHQFYFLRYLAEKFNELAGYYLVSVFVLRFA